MFNPENLGKMREDDLVDSYDCLEMRASNTNSVFIVSVRVFFF